MSAEHGEQPSACPLCKGFAAFHTEASTTFFQCANMDCDAHRGLALGHSLEEGHRLYEMAQKRWALYAPAGGAA